MKTELPSHRSGSGTIQLYGTHTAHKLVGAPAMSRPTSDGIELYKSVGANPVREALTAPLLSAPPSVLCSASSSAS